VRVGGKKRRYYQCLNSKARGEEYNITIITVIIRGEKKIKKLIKLKKLKKIIEKTEP
jgi:hypothetical protein